MHTYQLLNLGEKTKGHGWIEKQVEDNTHAHQGLESVVAMLWYQQTKRYEDQRAEATLHEGEDNGDGEGTENDESNPEKTSSDRRATLTLTDPDQPKTSPNTLSVDC